MSGFLEQFSDFEPEPMPEQPPKREENAFANRSDTTKPYVSGNRHGRNSPPPLAVQIKDDSYYSWNRFFLGAPPVSGFESKIRGMYSREKLGPENFDETKKDFILTYKQQLEIENQ